MQKQKRISLIGTAVLLLTSSLAMAAPVVIEVQGPAHDNKFHYSYLHTADMGDGTYFYSGDLLASLSGTLEADLTGDLLTIDPGELMMTGMNGWPGGSMTVWGSIDFADSDGDQLLGKLYYHAEWYDEVTRDGEWYFFDEVFSDADQPPNDLYGDGTLRLWGNDWHNLDALAAVDATVFAPDGLGIDIGATVRPIPEPHSMLLMTLGSLIVGGAILRQRRS